MAKKRQRLFSESWHLVATRHAVLRPAVEARRQTYRGDPWYVLYDPLRQEYFRITEGAYNFIARLNKGRTIDHVWRTCMEENPDETPVQDEVIQLLAQLNQSNLLETDLPQDAGKMYEARNKMREKKIRAQALNFLFVRVPLFDPDFIFKPLGKLLRPFCSLAGFLVWLGWMFFGVKLFIDHFGEFTSQGQGLLAPENLVWLFVATVGLKTLHEVGHGVVCRAFGGGVHKIGIMFLIFMPLPYVDASSSWSFTSKWRRVAVAFAGMMVELAIAVGALWVWANTGDAATKTLTYNIVVVASVGTILFNMNPLLKFDGYYILSDWLAVPNLQQRAQSQLIYIGERYIFGVKSAESKVLSFGEATFLATYGIAAFCYRIFLMASIALLVSEQYFELGIAIAALLAVTAFIIPLGKFANYLLFSPKLDDVRGAALLTVSLVLVLIATFLLSFKVEDRFTAPGVLQELSEQYVYSPAAGFVLEVHAQSGQWVEQGQLLFTLGNPELDLEISIAGAIIEQREFYFQLAQRQDFSTLGVWQSMIRNERERLRLLQSDRANLQVRAHGSGFWFSPEIRHMYGLRVERGQELGRIVQPGTLSFIAVVSQPQAAKMFDGADWRAEVRFHGRAASVVEARVVSVVESGRRVLPSAALGWTGGGTIKTVDSDQTGRLAAEDFFEVRLMLDAEQLRVLDPVNGQRARVRIATGEITVGGMLWRWVRQLLQRRLQI